MVPSHAHYGAVHMVWRWQIAYFPMGRCRIRVLPMHPWIMDDTPPMPHLSVGLCCRLQAIVKTLSDAASTAGVFSSSKAAAYWSYHITRSGFFAIQGIAGMRHMAVVHTALRHACHQS